MCIVDLGKAISRANALCPREGRASPGLSSEEIKSSQYIQKMPTVALSPLDIYGLKTFPYRDCSYQD